MFWNWDNTVLVVFQCVCVALPAAGLPVFLERFVRGWWVLVLPLSIVVCIGAIELFPVSATVYSWMALLLVPPGCALALGWAMHGARPPIGLLAAPLLAVVWIWPHTRIGELSGDALIAGSAVTLGRLLGKSAPLPLLKLGLVAMAVIDAIMVFGNTLEAPNDALVAAVPAQGLPQLQAGAFGTFSLGYGDFLAAAVLGGIIAVEKGPQIRLAIALFVVSIAWDQLFLVKDTLPATVPPALVLLGWEGFNGRVMLRRTAPLLTLISFFALAASAFASAGGGSSGFGGGGGGFSGGGGGGFSSGGGGSTCYRNCGGGAFVFVIIVIGVLLFLAYGAYLNRKLRKKRAKRVRAVELASAEAAADDEAFDKDLVMKQSLELFMNVQQAWDAGDRAKLAAMVGPELMKEWTRRLDDFDRKGWRNRVKPMQQPDIAWVGLTNRTDDKEDRVVVRIECRMHDFVMTKSGAHIKKNDSDNEMSTLAEYWTLEKRDSRWCLLSIEQDAEGAHQMDAPIVASPWGDDRLKDEAVAERAAEEAAPAGTNPAELADLDFTGTARAAAMDLSLADGRFDVDLIEASVRRAVAGWIEAVDGDDDALEAAARPEVIQELLHPGDPSMKTRLVVRGSKVDKITIAHLDAQAQPARIAVEVQVTGARYIEDRDTAALISGSNSSNTTFTERWTLALDADGEWPWRIASTGATVPS